ncbi:MAG: hypothetical protein ABJE10_21590 [bacterium]
MTPDSRAARAQLLGVIALFLAVGLLCVIAPRAIAQAPPPNPLCLTADWDQSRYQPHDASLRFTLTRPLRADDGRLAILVGNADLTALADVNGVRLQLPLRGEHLADGDIAVVAYLVSAEGDWTELAHFTLKRLTRAGLESVHARPTVNLQSDGQLRARQSLEATPGAQAATFQNVSLNAGLESALSRDGTDIALQGLLVGASREPARLRAQQLGTRAPALDLASYNLRFTHPGIALSAGHVGVGNQRHLINQFRSRGISAELQPMRALQIGVGVVAGSELVGWDDPLGLARSTHRVVVGSLGLEMVPSQPGTLRLDLTTLNGSLQPAPAFNQQSITDREASRGLGWQLTTSDPSQRIRFVAGIAQSRFDNPVDPSLSGVATLVPVRRETRAAKFAELALAVVRNAKLGPVATSLAIAARHERIDPQYRSVAVTLQADRLQDGIDVSGNVDVLQFQYATTRGRDNLDHIASLLTTRSRGQSFTLSIPVAQLVRAADGAWWWPSLSAGWQAAWQVGDDAPENGGFRFPFQVPDQRADNITAGAIWQRSIWNVVWHYSRSVVDNRQTDRQQSDVFANAQGVTIAIVPSPRLTLGVDLSADAQRSMETGAEAHNRRVGAQMDSRLLSSTALNLVIASTVADDRLTTRRGDNLELRAEASQGVNLYRRPQDGSQMRVFVRYARADAALRIADALQPTQRSWTLNSGLSLRFF